MNAPEIATAIESLLAALRAPATPSAPAAPPAPEFMTVGEFAARLEVCDRTVRRMIEAGMPCVRPRPRLVRILVAQAEKWITDQTHHGSVERAMKLGAVVARRGAP